MTEAIYLEVAEKAEAARKAKRRVSVSGMLKILGVSRAGYNAWLKHVPSNAEKRREAVKAKIKDIYDESKQNYGAPKITQVLRKAGEIISERTVGQYMKQMGIKAQWVKPWTITTKDSDFSNELQNILDEQYGHVKMRFEPSGDLDTPYVFQEEVVGGAVPKNYFPAVEKGLQESVLKGPLAGYPVVGVKATLYDGSYHPVDSSEMAFKTATIQAFKKGFMEAGPVLLEPIASVKVTVPDDYTGDVMGDLNKRRGRVLGMNPQSGGYQVIEADVPMTGMFGYCTTLRSMTGGRGSYSYEFARYEQAPADVQEKEIEKRAAEE